MNNSQRVLNSIDYNAHLRNLLEENGYEEIVITGNKNLLDEPIYKKSDDVIKNYFLNATSKGIIGRLVEQDKTGRTFRHIFLNKTDDDVIHYRLYLCPKDEYLYYLVNQILSRCAKSGEPIHLKYSRENRYDKILLFIKNQDELKRKIRLLAKIKQDYPILFTDMQKSTAWLSESPIKGVYLAPEKMVKRDVNVEYRSYTLAYVHLLNNVRNELLFYYRTTNIEDLKRIQHSELLNMFIYFFKRELGKMGLLLFFDENMQLNTYINDLFPGFGKSTDEDILLTKKGLQVGKRLDSNNKKYYIIPFGANLPNNPQEYNNYNYYVLDDKTAYMKRMYPHLYPDDDFGNK